MIRILKTTGMSGGAARVYQLVASSKRLRQQVYPEDPGNGPYRVLDYQAILTLEDPRGSVATFRRRQAVEFLQAGVSAILDHAWGDGILLTHYQHSAGPLEDSFKDGRCRHLVIGLERAMT